MPNGIKPLSQDDKDWKLAMERESARQAALIETLLKRIDELSKRR